MPRTDYATTEGGKRIDAVARGICQSRNADTHPSCIEACRGGCTAQDGVLVWNGSFDLACAAVLALDRYDEAAAADSSSTDKDKP